MSLIFWHTMYTTLYHYYCDLWNVRCSITTDTTSTGRKLSRVCSTCTGRREILSTVSGVGRSSWRSRNTPGWKKAMHQYRMFLFLSTQTKWRRSTWRKRWSISTFCSPMISAFCLSMITFSTLKLIRCLFTILSCCWSPFFLFFLNIIFVEIFCRAMLYRRGPCRHAVCVGVCVCVCVSHSYILSKRINISSKFSLSASQAILVFPYQTAWRYNDDNPPNGAV